METATQGKAWTLEAVQQLKELAREGVPTATIAARLRRSEAEIHGKAAELGLNLKIG